MPGPLTALRLQDFRCFDRAAVELSEGATLFIGDNAQGKTSLLEAACVLLRLQSPRTAVAADLIRFGRQGYGIGGDNGPHRLQLLFREGKRQLAVDGLEAKSTGYLAAAGLIVWMGNDDLALVRGGSEGRRRYLDFLGAQAFHEYRAALLAYDKALRSRNRLLKEERPDWRQIEAYTHPLIEHGTVLTRLRSDLILEVQPWAAEAHAHISERAGETLALAYQPGATDDFAAALDASRAEETRRRQTVIGPHRDDLVLTLNGAPADKFASEGQQRTIALALKLAQARLLEALRSEPPLLLIDDVFGELDPRRRNALLRGLPAASQKVITTTHLGWMQDDAPLSRPRLYTVSAGRVTPA